MLKSVIFGLVLMIAAGHAQAQSRAKKMSKEEAAGKTQDQRIVHEGNRKSKSGKKKLSTKEKVKIDQKQDRRARRTKAAKGRKK